METERKVKDVIVPVAATEGAGVHVRRSLATPYLDHLDPFFLFDRLGSENPHDYIAGFPMHPHRGIETVTYVLEGGLTHRDSLGNEGTLGAGDVQWMTAGSGILHEEMPHVGERGLDFFHVWVNLPRQLKMTAPRCRDVPSARIPEVEAAGGVRVRVIAGEVDGIAGAVRELFAGPSFLDVTLPAGAMFEQPVARGHTALLYPFRGAVEVGRISVPSPRLAILGDGDVVRVRAGDASARLLLLSAQPLDEPAVRWGPFVMNTEEQIRDAIRDLQEGTFVKAAPARRARMLLH